MVAGKVKLAMGLHKSPENQNTQVQPQYPQQRRNTSSLPISDGKDMVPQKGARFSRSFGNYFPRSSAQVQPRPPDVAELLNLIEELRERESLLRTELGEQKLLKEHEISRKETEIVRSTKKIECLEAENEQLRQEVEMLHMKLTEQKQEFKKKIKDSELTSQLMDVSARSNIVKSLQRTTTLTNSKETIGIDNLRMHSRCDSLEMAESILAVRSRVPRVPKPPPTSTYSPSSFSSPNTRLTEQQPPAPPPPPPPPRTIHAVAPPPPPPPTKVVKVKRVPEVVEFYHSLMRRDSRRDSGTGGLAGDVSSSANARDMIGEIENRSAHLIAIKTDVETQGEFIRYLIKQVEDAAFTDIDDVLPFVKWLDDELSNLVDERAVLKHFDWPEHKADALREAAFGFFDLKKLESEAKSFHDDPRQPCAPALKKMQALLEKLEHGVYNLSRMRELTSTRYKVFRIPIDWMQEKGLVTQIKLASVKLAVKYMTRVSAELETGGNGIEEQELIVQGVKFAFRVHQFAGGFDAETMRAFKELRDQCRTRN